jgi:hypothetical protein
MSTQRTDAHAPASFDPADYRVIDYLDGKQPEYAPGMPVEMYEAVVKSWRDRILHHFPDWRTGGTDHTSIFACNHCGHPGLRWIAVVEHVPTGAKLAFGETCADRTELDGRDDFRSRFIKTRAALEAAALANRVRKAEFAEANAEVVAFLDLMEAREAAWREENEAIWAEDEARGYEGRPRKNKLPSVHPFLNDMVHALNRKGELSENQVNAVRKFMASEETFEAARAAREAEEAAHAPTGPLAEGRREVAGEILTAKFQDGDYGSTPKMLVREDDGNKVWMTIPDAAFSGPGGDRHIDEFKGNRVALTATVARSRDDEHFGFGKRPTKVTIDWKEEA